MRRSLSRVILALLIACTASCGDDRVAPHPRTDIAWKRLGSWSGRGSTQTESFTSDTGALRVEWQTKAGTTSAAGRFILTIHSAISGRPLQQAVDHEGAGRGTAYVTDDPRVFFAVVDSAGLDWTFTIEEGVTH
jgi:hypothetical protein